MKRIKYWSMAAVILLAACGQTTDAVNPEATQPSATPVITPVTTQPSATQVTTPVTTQPSATPVTTPVTTQPSATPVTTPVTTQPSATPVTTPVTTQPSATPVTTPVTAQPSATPVTTPVTTQPSATPSQAPVNNAPEISLQAQVTADELTTVDLNPAATDPDGDALTFEWMQTSGTTVSFSTTDSANTSVTLPNVSANETIELTLTVTDAKGLTSTAQQVINVVNNLAPTVSITGDSKVTERESIQLTLTADDSDGSIAEVTWQQTEGPTQSWQVGADNSLSFTAQVVQANTDLTFVVTVTDEDGEQTTASHAVTINVNPTDVVDINVTAYAACAQAENGDVKCWGEGGYYNLNNGNTGYVGDEASDAGLNMPTLDFGSRTAIFVEAGYRHGCALFDDGAVSCWGQRDYAGLGATTPDKFVGDDPSETGDGLPLVDLGTGRTAERISVGSYHTCAVLDNGGVKCWGSNRDGKLGYGSTDFVGDDLAEMGDNLPYVDLGTDEFGEPYTAKQVAAGYEFTCALLHDDRMKCWGDNSGAQLGYGDFEDRGGNPNEMGNNLPVIDLGTGVKVSQIFAYYNRNCAILSDGNAKCWGQNNEGELGLGTGDGYVGNNVPNKYNKISQCSDGTNQAVIDISAASLAQCVNGGLKIQYGLDAAGNGSLASNIATRTVCHSHDLEVVTSLIADDNSCANSGKVVYFDFDANKDGELDAGDYPTGIDQNGTRANLMGGALPTLQVGANVIDFAMGDSHICLLTSDNEVKCLGGASSAQAGTDDTMGYGNKAGETPELRQAIDFGTGLHAVKIAGSYEYNCAILNNGKVKCWGYDNGSATLGVPKYFDQYIGDGTASVDGSIVTVEEMGDNLEFLNLFRE